MYSSVHSASSHTGSLQITISFWGLFGCEISEFNIQSRTTRFFRPAPGFSTYQSSQITEFSNLLHPKPSRMYRSVKGSFCHVIRARNELIRSVEHLVQL